MAVFRERKKDLDFASNEDPDQPGHPPTLISLHSPHEERYERSFTTHLAHSEDSDPPSLIRVFDGRIAVTDKHQRRQIVRIQYV